MHLAEPGRSGPHGSSSSLQTVREHLRTMGATFQKQADLQTAILDSLTSHIAVLSADGVITAINKAWHRFASDNQFSDPAFGVGQNYLQVCERVHHEQSSDGQLVAIGLRHVLEGQLDAFTHEYPCHAPNEQRWFLLTITPLSAERRDGAVIAHINITQRKLAEIALQESETRFRTAFDQAAVGVAHVAADGRFRRVNERLCTMLGFTHEELCQKTFADLSFPDCRGPSEAARQAMLVGTQSSYSAEKRYRTKNGEALWANLVTTVVRQHSEPPYFISIIEDITARKAADLRLQRINRLYVVLSKIGAAIVKAQTPSQLYDQVCRILVNDGLFRVALIAEAEPGGTNIRTIAVAGDTGNYLDTFIISQDDHSAHSQGPLGTAFRTGRHDVCNNFAQDPRMAPWQVAAASNNLRAAAAFPLTADGVVTSAFVLFSEEADYFLADEISLMLAVGNNISFALDQQHAREAVRLSEERFRLLAKATNDVIWDWDVASNEIWRNQGLEALFGYPPNEIEPLFEFWTSRIHPDDRQRITDSLDHAMRTGASVWSQDYRFRRHDGSYAYTTDRGHLIRDAEGNTIRMIGGMNDLTARKQADERIAEQAALLDQARDAIAVRDLLHRTTYMNKGAEQVYGWSAVEVMGKSFRELAFKDSTAYDKAMEAVLERGEWAGELSPISKEGRQLLTEARWSLVRDQAGQPKSILSICTDVTDKRTIEKQFLRAQRLESIGTLAGGIAHDLNNVLAPILLSINLLMTGETDKRRLRTLSIIDSSAKRGADMVKQVLSFARGVDGQRLPVDIRQLIRDIETIINQTFLKNIQPRISIDPEIDFVIGDVTQLHQVLLNLCVNARDAMPDGGTLTLSAKNVLLDEHYATLHVEAIPGPYVVIQVEDTGIGIPHDVIDKIFEPFFTTKEINKGTGLGLTTSLAVAKSHGGFIRVYSEPGRGSTFTLHLPAVKAANAGTSTIERPALPRGNGELILVVDDEEGIRQITRQILEAFGYRVLLAIDGSDALALFAEQQHDISLVLTDMMMPIMDGNAVIRVLMKMRPDVRIIAASGLNENHVVAKAISGGVKHFLAKPYTADSLLKIIREVLTPAL